MSVSHIASFTARIGTTAVTPQGFGTPLILVYTTAFPEDVKTYTGDNAEILGAMSDDGLTAGSPAYTMASRLLEQDFKPRTIKVGRLDTAHAQSVDLTPKNLTAGSVYNLVVTLNGTTETATFTADATPTAAEIATGLTSAVNAFTTVAVTATDNTGSLTLDVDNSGDVFSLGVIVNGVKMNPADMDLIDSTAAPVGLATRLDEILAADNDFFFFMADISSVAIATVMATWASTNRKMFMAATSDSDATELGTSTDIGAVITSAGNNYCVPYFDGKYNGYSNASHTGFMAPTTPGSATFAHKRLVNVTTPGINASLYANLDAKNYTTYRAANATISATVGGHVGGTYEKADVTRGIEWLIARSQEAIANLLLSNLKTPFTEAGRLAIRDALQSVISLGVANGLISPGDPTNESEDPTPKVVIPPIANVSTADKAARVYRNIKLTLRLSGAIEKIIAGQIAAEF